ncbi:MAG: Fic family protein [Solirubrobacterales bacterium]|nr:Fic family protein [Solirubrobacterales bacterium]
MYVAPPPKYFDLVSQLGSDRMIELMLLGVMEDGRSYVHWDTLRQLEPPANLSHDEWWWLIKWGRTPLQRAIPLTDASGETFVYGVPDLVARGLHYVDQRCAGEVAMPEVVTADDQARQQYLVNSLMEEAIRSSQLEGATTTRRVAKELLQTGRAPKDRSERMILNNYRALQYMRDGMPDQLTPRTVLELQRILTDGTLENPDAAGRLQRPGEDRIAVVDRIDGSVVHQPPPADQLPERLQALCDFANERENPDRFIHPVVRAILLHFWLAYDHPFEDGNGRTARALFYWYMRISGYWLVEYLSISRILRQAPAKYSRSFVLTETDERDATYFLVYQLDVIQRAVRQLHAYLGQKIKDLRDVEGLLKGSSQFNHRQLALLGNAMRTPDAIYTHQSHASRHGVTHETARSDLLPLVALGFLEQRRQGRRYVFTPPVDLPVRLKASH